MVILRIDENNVEETAPLVADFRVELNSYKGIEARPDIQEGKEDLFYFLKAQYPVFVAKEDGKAVGYLVCRIEDGVLWVAFGSALTFGAASKASAPGQIGVHELKQVLDIIHKSL